MTFRTAHRTVTFKRPFRLDGVDGVQPPGAYEVDTDEELIGGVSVVAWRRTSTTIRLGRAGLTQVFAIDPVDLEASLMRDAGMTVLPAAPADEQAARTDRTPPDPRRRRHTA